MAKPLLPPQLNICIVGRRIRLQSRATDTGYLWPLARGLVKIGHQVTLLSFRSPMAKGFVERDGVKAWFLADEGLVSRMPEFPAAARSKFLALHKEKPFHIVHGLDNSAMDIAGLKGSQRVPVVYDVEATQISQLFSILGMAQETATSALFTYIALIYKFLRTWLGTDRHLLKNADGIFVSTPQQRVILERYYLYPDWHIHTVPYGLDLSDLAPREKPSDLRTKLGIPETAHIVVSPTDMSDVQEVLPLLKAFERVAVKKPNSWLILLGSGPKLKEIEYEVLNLALGSRVLMPGAVGESETQEYVALADVFVNLSSRSTFETLMIEAMAQRKVILGSEVSPILHMVEDGVDGFLVRPADSESIANILLEIFSGTMPIHEIGESARKKVLELFDAGKMVQMVAAAYEQVLLRRGYYRK